jgi:thiol-disulfide isomerase/thioredoxin
MTVGLLPGLPLTCLKTADFKSTEDVMKGKPTIIGKFDLKFTSFIFIFQSCLRQVKAHSHTYLYTYLCFFILDFWTTKCTRCPDALDKLENMAKDPKYENVRFVSICCDKLDGARDIIEKEDDLRWQHVDHYYMDSVHKEQAKKILGFKSVPFYVVVDETGEIQQKGSEKAVDFDDVPGVVRPEPEPELVPEPKHTFFTPAVVFEEEKKEGDICDYQQPQEPEPAVDRVFVLDDFDF